MDKGRAVVIINVADYLKEGKCQLDNMEVYQKTHADIVNEAIRKFVKEKLLKEHSAKALTIYDRKQQDSTAKSTQEKSTITNAIGIPTSTIAEFVDFQLQPLVEKLKSYLKDTTDFLTKLTKIENLPKDSFLITMDIASLYTNILHKEGINAVAQSLEENNSVSISTRVIVKFLSLVLNLNNFTFNDDMGKFETNQNLSPD